MAKAELMDVVQGAGTLLMASLRLDDALCSELVRRGVLDLGPEGLFRNQHERLQALMESMSQNKDKFGKFISMLEEYEEYRAVRGILAGRLEGMSGASRPPVPWQNAEVFIEVGVRPGTGTILLIQPLIESGFMKSGGEPIHLEIISIYGILITEVSEGLVLTAQLLETADPSLLLTNIKDGTFAAMLTRHIYVQHPEHSALVITVRLDADSERLLQLMQAPEEHSGEKEKQITSNRVTHTEDRTHDRRMTILNNILMIPITTNQPLAYFYSLIMKYKDNPDICRLESPKGLPLLHECIHNKKKDFLVAFLYSCSWEVAFSMKVINPDSEFFNQSPYEFAKATSNVAAQHELERLERLSQAIEIEPLKKACLHGDTRSFMEILPANPKEVTRVTEKLTCLDLAIGSGVLDIVRVVCESEKKVGFKRQKYDDQLRLCVELSQHDMIFLLSTYGQLNAKIAAGPGKSIIERAAEIGDVPTFQVLLDIGGKFPVTALCLSAASGQAEFVKACLTTYGNLVDLTYQDKRQKNAIQFAIEKGHLRIVDLLLNYVTDIQHADKRSRTVFHSAAEKGNPEVMKILLERTKDKVNLCEMLKQKDHFLGNELCFLVRGRAEGHAAWHYILSDRALLHDFKVNMQHGSVDVGNYGKNITSGWGAQPSLSKIKEVESKFDSLNMSDDAPADMTPLHIAVMKDHTQAALYLLEAMDEVNLQDHFQLTPLHLACMRGNMQIIKALEQKGALWDLTDIKGRTPDEVARLNHHEHVLRYIKDGSIHRATQMFMRVSVAPLMEKLTSAEMESRLENGVNIKEYVKESLKDLNGDINAFLYDHLQTGPIAAATDE